jgi:hypothetical protein
MYHASFAGCLELGCIEMWTRLQAIMTFRMWFQLRRDIDRGVDVVLRKRFR